VAKARRIEEELEARRCLQAVAASGRPLAAWAREHGIDGRSLNAWRVVTDQRHREAAEFGPCEPGRGPAASTAFRAQSA